MFEIADIATGLLFPEGPVVLPDGSVLVSEGARRGVARIGTDGELRRYPVSRYALRLRPGARRAAIHVQQRGHHLPDAPWRSGTSI